MHSHSVRAAEGARDTCEHGQVLCGACEERDMRGSDESDADRLARSIADFVFPRIVVDPSVPATELLLHVDYLERLEAMTLHHVDLSLLDLAEEQPCAVFELGAVRVHPDNLPLLTRIVKS